MNFFRQTSPCATFKHWGSIIIFAVAALGGGYMFGRDIRHKEFPVWFVVVHAIIGLGGLVWLVMHLLGSGH